MPTGSLIADTSQLDLSKAGERGKELWARLIAGPVFDELVVDCQRYGDDDWAAPRGAWALPGYDPVKHGRVYTTEGLKPLVINTAAGGMVPLPGPIDAVMHAAFTQTAHMERLRAMGINPSHGTLQEAGLPAYEPGCVPDRDGVLHGTPRPGLGQGFI